MQDVVQALVCPRLLNGHGARGVFHDANEPLIAAGVRANGARNAVGEIAAYRAARDKAPRLKNGFAQRCSLLFGRRQKMKRQTLGGPFSHSREPPQSIHQLLECGRVRKHTSPEMPGLADSIQAQQSSRAMWQTPGLAALLPIPGALPVLSECPPGPGRYARRGGPSHAE